MTIVADTGATIVADTGALYAAVDRRDTHHAAVGAFVGATDERLLIPPLVLAELDYLLGQRLGEETRAAVIANVLETCDIAPVTHADVVQAADIANRYADLELGLTDASVMVAAHAYGTRDLLSVDQRHFRVVRPIGAPPGGTFRLLPFDR